MKNKTLIFILIATVIGLWIWKKYEGFGTIIEASVPADLEFVGELGARVPDQSSPNQFHQEFNIDKYSTGISYEPWSSDWQPLPVDIDRLATKDTRYTRMSTLPYSIPPWSSPDRVTM